MGCVDSSLRPYFPLYKAPAAWPYAAALINRVEIAFKMAFITATWIPSHLLSPRSYPFSGADFKEMHAYRHLLVNLNDLSLSFKPSSRQPPYSEPRVFLLQEIHAVFLAKIVSISSSGPVALGLYTYWKEIEKDPEADPLPLFKALAAYERLEVSLKKRRAFCRTAICFLDKQLKKISPESIIKTEIVKAAQHCDANEVVFMKAALQNIVTYFFPIFHLSLVSDFITYSWTLLYEIEKSKKKEQLLPIATKSIENLACMALQVFQKEYCDPNGSNQMHKFFFLIETSYLLMKLECFAHANSFFQEIQTMINKSDQPPWRTGYRRQYRDLLTAYAKHYPNNLLALGQLPILIRRTS